MPPPVLLAITVALVGIVALALVLRRASPSRPGTAKPASAEGVASGEPPLPQAELLDLKGAVFQEPVRLTKQHVRIGRTPDNEIVIPGGAVSALHATIDYRDGAFYLEDQRSSNGTWLNNDRQRLQPNQPIRLKSGDRIRFDVYELKFLAAQQPTAGGTILSQGGGRGPTGTILTEPGAADAPAASDSAGEAHSDEHRPEGDEVAPQETHLKTDMCPNHESLRASELCSVCKRAFCSLCVSEREGERVCNECQEKFEHPVKRKLREQVDNAEATGHDLDRALALWKEQVRLARGDIKATVEAARKLVERGDFAGARDRVHNLPDTPALSELKGSLLRQIDEVERSSEPPVRGLLRRVFARLKPRPRDTPAAITRGRSGTAAMPTVVSDLVHFSITSPPAVTSPATYLMDVWAHLEGQRQEVMRRAREEAARGEISVKTKGPVMIERGNILTVRPRIQGFTVDPPQDTILWEGQIGNATFAVRVPRDAETGAHTGMCEFHVNGLRVATLRFLIRVEAVAAQRKAIRFQEERARRAFASYASEDRDAVLARIQGLQKGIPDLDVFLDVVSLRSGQRWRGRLQSEILSRDVLYLFWSEPASHSEWVDWEWRCGYQARGVDFIDPVPLVSPQVVPPPPELAALHFDDWTLGYLRGGGNPAHGCGQQA